MSMYEDTRMSISKGKVGRPGLPLGGGGTVRLSVQAIERAHFDPSLLEIPSKMCYRFSLRAVPRSSRGSPGTFKVSI